MTHSEKNNPTLKEQYRSLLQQSIASVPNYDPGECHNLVSMATVAEIARLDYWGEPLEGITDRIGLVIRRLSDAGALQSALGKAPVDNGGLIETMLELHKHFFWLSLFAHRQKERDQENRFRKS